MRNSAYLKSTSGYLFILALFGSLGCSKAQDLYRKSENHEPSSPSALKFQLNQGTFANCEEVQSTVKEQLNRRIADQQKADSASDSMVMDSAVAPASGEGQIEVAKDSSSSITNTQEKGVDEEDFVKTTVKHLIVLRGHRLEVIDRQSLALRSSYDLSPNYGPMGTIFSAGVTDLRFYTQGSSLIVIGTPQLKVNTSFLSSHIPASSTRLSSSDLVRVLVLDEKPDGSLELRGQKDIVGKYLDSRISNGRLYLVAQDAGLPLDPAPGKEIEENLWPEAEGRIQGVPCERIAKQAIEDLDFAMTKVAAIDLSDLSQEIEQLAVLGGGEHIYMTERNLYITKSRIHWQPSTSPMYEDYFDSTVITRIQLDSTEGRLSLGGQGLVKGHVQNQFHFQEYGAAGVLALATTAFTSRDIHLEAPGQKIGVGLNHLWILRLEANSLEVVNGLYHFGKPGEDIRAVRFQGPHAYIVTFKKTDPLYAFDLSDPTQPRLEGELEIPGFSMYLHPLAPGRLFGVGYEAEDQGNFAYYQGIQVSLFDASDLRDPKRLDVKIHGHRGSYADVTANHHAFYYDAASETVGLPLVELQVTQGSKSWQIATQLQFSGAVAYGVSGDKLTELARVSHRDMMSNQCLDRLAQGRWWQSGGDSMDVNRFFRLDDRWISVSRFGIKAHDPAQQFREITSLPFERLKQDCMDSYIEFAD